MERKNWYKKVFLGIVVVSFLFPVMFSRLHAQSILIATPLVTATPTVTPTATVTTSDTATATPTPTQSVAAISSQYVSGSATVKTQYPWNKKIPVTLTIVPKVSGSRLEVRWQSKAGLVASPTSMTLQNPQAGGTYTVSFLLTPFAPGFQRAVADIILTTTTTNYVSSVDVPVQLSADKIVLPITSTYTAYQVGMYVAIFLVFFVAIPYCLYLLYKYVKTNVFPKWLEAKIKSGR